MMLKHTIGALLTGIGLTFWAQACKSTSAENESGASEPTAKVAVVALRSGHIDKKITVYGVVEAETGEAQTYSVPFECRVSRVLAADGQQVSAGDGLVEVQPSPEARLHISVLRQERDAAKTQLELLKQKFDMKMATRQDVLTAEQALAFAELNLQNFRKLGVAGKHILRALGQGLVLAIDAQQGEIVPAGAPIARLVTEDHIAIRLGVESEDVSSLQKGQTLEVQPVNDSPRSFKGTLTHITRKVDPETRLVSVYAKPNPDAHLLLNDYVRARIAIASHDGLLVPSAAVIKEKDGFVLFTVENGRAKKHRVRVGLSDEEQTEVAAHDLSKGQKVVVMGNAELTDGMAVSTEPTP